MSADRRAETISQKNVCLIQCKHCTSVILQPGTADLIELEYDLPTIKQDMRNTSTICESINQFWMIKDIFIFHNIGFSHTVGNIKYLACADCDAGPIGYHDISTKISYVAINRVSSF